VAQLVVVVVVVVAELVVVVADNIPVQYMLLIYT
jgi:hypothetical protein